MAKKKDKKKEPEKEISLGDIIGGRIILDPKVYGDYEEIIVKDIKKFTMSGSHVILPREHEGKEARIMIKRKKQGEKKEQSK